MKPGTELRSRYSIVKTLGSGGQGEVFLATDQQSGGSVAIKTIEIEADEAEDEHTKKIVAQFQVEADILNRLSHSGIPHFSDFFEENGRYCIVMDYVPGKTVRQVLQEYGPMEERQVLYYAREIAQLLHYLHSSQVNVIVRDLKSDNLILSDDGHMNLVDFGIAKLDEASQTKTMARGAGTAGFASPEQYGFASTDARSDIYSLGATLYHMLTGSIPPPSVDLMMGTATLIPIRKKNPGIHLATSVLIERMMALRRESRIGSATEVLAALDRIPVSKRVLDPAVVRTRPDPEEDGKHTVRLPPVVVAPSRPGQDGVGVDGVVVKARAVQPVRHSLWPLLGARLGIGIVVGLIGGRILDPSLVSGGVCLTLLGLACGGLEGWCRRSVGAGLVGAVVGTLLGSAGLFLFPLTRTILPAAVAASVPLLGISLMDGLVHRSLVRAGIGFLFGWMAVVLVVLLPSFGVHPSPLVVGAALGLLLGISHLLSDMME